jgi:hypothetical protein
LKAELIGSLSVNPADKSNRLEVQLLQHSQLENYLGGSNAMQLWLVEAMQLWLSKDHAI